MRVTTSLHHLRDVNSDVSALVRRFGMLLDAVPDATVGVDADGRIELVNAQAESLFGYEPGALIGKQVETILPQAVSSGEQGHRKFYFDHPITQSAHPTRDFTGRRSDGTEFPAEILFSSVGNGDRPVVLAAVRDVTARIRAQVAKESLKAGAERESLESQLHQAQRLESLGQLAGGVAHDFNNLLTVILNYTSFVSEEVARLASEPGGQRWLAVGSDLDQIQLAGQLATVLTHRLLTFGRRDVVRPRVIDLSKVITNVEQFLRRSIGEHVQFVLELDPEIWPVVADPGQIEQVLVNLAVNARDAMPEGGVLTLRKKNQSIDASEAARKVGLEPGRYVSVEVSDTGTGMNDETLQHLFEPFFTTKPHGEGTGLGLATVYGIITQAGGYIEVRSTLGSGSTFRALLPVSSSGADEPDLVDEFEPRGGNETILVVEDEEAIRALAKRILERNGYTVISTGRGREAIAVAREYAGNIHLLLSDVIMPEMLGKAVAREVQAISPTIRVLYMSGSQPVLASRGTLDAGVTLVVKPFSERELLASIREVLDATA